MEVDMLFRVILAAVAILAMASGPALARSQHNNMPNQHHKPWCTGKKGQVEGQNCRMPQ